MGNLKIEKTLRKLCLEAVTFSETGNNREKWTRLYHAKIGDSGWSIGRVQFDISKNRQGREMLMDCGVTPQDIKFLNNLPRDDEQLLPVIARVNSIMSTPLAFRIMDEASQAYIDKGLYRINDLAGIGHLELRTLDLLFLLDYHTQFHISVEGTCHDWLETLQHFSIHQFMEFKKTLPWYAKPEGVRDTQRRFDCVMKFAQERRIEEYRGDEGIKTYKTPDDFDPCPDWLRE